jgi:DNA-binding transcriptional MocR family regulator
MTNWVPVLASRPGPRYLAFVSALEADIAAGRVKPGTRLLPQREMAQRLALSVGTISKAYAEAEQRGLISGEVGRGTFVQKRRLEQRSLGPSEATINLALNVPPYTGEDDVIAAVLGDIGFQRGNEGEIAWPGTRSESRYPVGHFALSARRICTTGDRWFF